MTPEDKAYYSEPYYPLFKLMSEEFGLTLLEQDLSEIMNCVRKMDEARKEQSVFISEDSPQRTRVVNPLLLECIVRPATRYFTYYDFSTKENVKQHVANYRIRVFYPTSVMQ